MRESFSFSKLMLLYFERISAVSFKMWAEQTPLTSQALIQVYLHLSEKREERVVGEVSSKNRVVLSSALHEEEKLFLVVKWHHSETSLESLPASSCQNLCDYSNK